MARSTSEFPLSRFGDDFLAELDDQLESVVEETNFHLVMKATIRSTTTTLYRHVHRLVTESLERQTIEIQRLLQAARLLPPSIPPDVSSSPSSFESSSSSSSASSSSSSPSLHISSTSFSSLNLQNTEAAAAADSHHNTISCSSSSSSFRSPPSAEPATSTTSSSSPPPPLFLSSSSESVQGDIDMMIQEDECDHRNIGDGGSLLHLAKTMDAADPTGSIEIEMNDVEEVAAAASQFLREGGGDLMKKGERGCIVDLSLLDVRHNVKATKLSPMCVSSDDHFHSLSSTTTSTAATATSARSNDSSGNVNNPSSSSSAREFGGGSNAANSKIGGMSGNSNGSVLCSLSSSSNVINSSTSSFNLNCGSGDNSSRQNRVMTASKDEEILLEVYEKVGGSFAEGEGPPQPPPPPLSSSFHAAAAPFSPRGVKRVLTDRSSVFLRNVDDSRRVMARRGSPSKVKEKIKDEEEVQREKIKGECKRNQLRENNEEDENKNVEEPTRFLEQNCEELTLVDVCPSDENRHSSESRGSYATANEDEGEEIVKSIIENRSRSSRKAEEEIMPRISEMEYEVTWSRPSLNKANVDLEEKTATVKTEEEEEEEDGNHDAEQLLLKLKPQQQQQQQPSAQVVRAYDDEIHHEKKEKKEKFLLLQDINKDILYRREVKAAIEGRTEARDISESEKVKKDKNFLIDQIELEETVLNLPSTSTTTTSSNVSKQQNGNPCSSGSSSSSAISLKSLNNNSKSRCSTTTSSSSETNCCINSKFRSGSSGSSSRRDDHHSLLLPGNEEEISNEKENAQPLTIISDRLDRKSIRLRTSISEASQKRSPYRKAIHYHSILTKLDKPKHLRSFDNYDLFQDLLTRAIAEAKKDTGINDVAAIKNDVILSKCGRGFFFTDPLNPEVRPSPDWCSDPTVLLEMLRKQSSWDALSILGSAPPEIDMIDQFNFETFNSNDAHVREKHKVLRNFRLENCGRVHGGLLDLNEWEHLYPRLKKMHRLERNKDLDWRRDPLLAKEVLWYKQAVNATEDVGWMVTDSEECYCPAPNPTTRWGWNDPRNRSRKSANLSLSRRYDKRLPCSKMAELPSQRRPTVSPKHSHISIGHHFLPLHHHQRERPEQ